jgi:CBS domain-containing protein
MTRDVITVAENADLDDAVELMERHHVKRLPVVNSAGVVGINLLHAFLVSAPKDAPAPVSDAAIRDRLTAEFKRQPWIPYGSVQVTVENGIVVLQGTIREERLRAALRVAAENIPGVKGVIDQLFCLDASHRG